MTTLVKAYEETGATSVFPDHIKDSAKALIGFIGEYYKHLNTLGLPSYELNNASLNHDIDTASDYYLDQIQSVIGRTIPQSNILDKKRLLKIVVNYYNTRGSEDSIYAFFKIFFNELVTVIYPSEYVFDTSGRRSNTSDKFRLQDGAYWQTFSYVVRSNLPTSEWRDEFMKFVHPGGLKLFAALILQFVAYMGTTTYTNDEDVDLLWNRIDWDASPGLHSPTYQAGWERDYNFEFIYKALIDDHNTSGLSNERVAYGSLNKYFSVDPNALFNFTRTYLISCLTKPTNDSLNIFHSEYVSWLKLLDPTLVSNGYLEFSTDDTLTYSDGYAKRFKGIGSFIEINEGVFVMSNYTEVEDTLTDWSSSETDDSDNDLPWITSSFI